MNTCLLHQTQNAKTRQTPIMVHIIMRRLFGHGGGGHSAFQGHPLISTLCLEAQSLHNEKWVNWGSLRIQVTEMNDHMDKNYRECSFQNVLNDLICPILYYKETKLLINLFQILHGKYMWVHIHRHTLEILTSSPEMPPLSNTVFVITNLKITTRPRLHENLL